MRITDEITTYLHLIDEIKELESQGNLTFTKSAQLRNARRRLSATEKIIENHRHNNNRSCQSKIGSARRINYMTFYPDTEPFRTYGNNTPMIIKNIDSELNAITVSPAPPNSQNLPSDAVINCDTIAVINER